MEVSKINPQISPEISKKKSRNVGSSISASILGTAASVPTTVGALGIMKLMSKIGKMPNDKIEIMHDAAQKAIEEAGLGKKGVNIQYLKPEKNGVSKWLKLFLPIEQIKDGKNAAFLNKDLLNLSTKEVLFAKNTVLMPEKEISYAAFHEIGHAMNFNLSKTGKMLQNIRTPAMLAAGLIPLYVAFTQNSKPKNGEEMSSGQKVKNFVRNNAGKLSFAAMIPILIEEGMATVKGQKLANKILSKDMAKIVSKGNKIAYVSYLLTAVGMGLTSYATVKIKDHLIAKKQNKA